MRGSMEDLQFVSNEKAEKGTGIKTWVTGTWPSNLQFQADIIELSEYYGMTDAAVAELMDCSRKTVHRVKKKYYPKYGEHDIVMLISSKV